MRLGFSCIGQKHAYTEKIKWQEKQPGKVGFCNLKASYPADPKFQKEAEYVTNGKTVKYIGRGEASETYYNFAVTAFCVLGAGGWKKNNQCW